MHELRAHDRRPCRLVPTEELPQVWRCHLAVEQAEAVRDEPAVARGAHGGGGGDSATPLAPRHAGVRRRREYRQPRDAAELLLKGRARPNVAIVSGRRGRRGEQDSLAKGLNRARLGRRRRQRRRRRRAGMRERVRRDGLDVAVDVAEKRARAAEKVRQPNCLFETPVRVRSRSAVRIHTKRRK